MKDKYLLFLLLHIVIWGFGQNPGANLYKYYYLRQRLRDDFVIVDAGNRQGTNIPAEMRNRWGGWLAYGENPMHGCIAPYLMLLASEYAVNKKYGLDNSQTLQELSYALLALDRMDLNTEKFFRAEAAGLDPEDSDFWTKVDAYIDSTRDLNGFSVRSDIDGRGNKPENRIYIEDEDKFIYNMNDSALKYVDYYSGEIIRAESFFNNNKFGLYGIQTNNRSVQSQDEIWRLYLGLSLVAKLVDSPQRFKNIKGIPVTIREWVADIVFRTQMNLTIDDNTGPSILNWRIKNPVTGEIVKQKNGGWTYALSYGFAWSASNIIGYTQAPNAQEEIIKIFLLLDKKAYIPFKAAQAGAFETYARGQSSGPFDLALVSGEASLKYYLKLMRKATNDTKTISFENYPLVWSILRDSSLADAWETLNNFITYNSYVDSLRMLLNAMPLCGSYADGSHNKISDPYWFYGRGFNSQRYRVDGFCALNPDGMRINSNMDYMLLFNLYYLLISDDLAIVDNLSNRDYPTPGPREYGSHRNPAEIQGINFVMNHKIGADGDVTLIAANRIELLPGFKVEAGGTFIASVEPIHPECNFNFTGAPCSSKTFSTAQIDTAENFNDFYYKNYQDTEKQVDDYAFLEDSTLIFNIYPNPVDTKLQIKINPAITPIRISLIDFSGHILKEYEEGKNTVEIDFSGYSAGIYVILLETEKNFYSQTIIKK